MPTASGILYLAVVHDAFSRRIVGWTAARPPRSQAEARMAVFSYVEGFYDPLRLHSALGYRSPNALEQNTEVDTSSPILIEQAPNRPSD